MKHNSEVIGDIKAGVVQELSTGWEYFWEDGKQKVVILGKNGKLIFDTPNRWRCRNCGNKFYWPSKPEVICKKCEDCKYYDRATPEPLKEPWYPYMRPVLSGNLDSIPQEIIGILKRWVVLQKPIEYQIIADWIIATYFYSQFQAFPYLSLDGVLNSGKSRMLKMLSWFSYRPILHASLSPSVLVREIDEFHPVELIDEVDTKFNNKSDRGRDFMDLMLEGYTQGSSYTRCKQGEDKGIVRHKVYCPKAFAGRRITYSALNSRCINISMRKETPEVEDLPKTLPDDVQEIRSKLLYLKLIGETLLVPEVALHGRTREKFLPIIAVEHHFNGDYSDIVEYGEKAEVKQDKEMTSTLEADILGEINNQLYDVGEWERARPKYIAERLDVKPEVVGWSIKSMGIPITRDKIGKYINLQDTETKDVLKELYKRHGIDADQKKLTG